MEHSEIILGVMDERGIKPYHISKAAGLSSSLFSKWKKSPTSDISSSILVHIADYLDCPIDDLLGRSAPPTAAPNLPKDMADALGKLNREGLERVTQYIDDLVASGRYARTASPMEATTEEPPEGKQIPLFLSPAAAGPMVPLAGSEYRPYTLRPEDPQDAQYAVRLEGDSMSPDFPDGSIVFCSFDTVRNGDIGIFALDTGTVCKQFYRDPFGIVYLFSLNRARADCDVVLPSTSGRALVCQGKVLTDKRYTIPGKDSPLSVPDSGTRGGRL